MIDIPEKVKRLYREGSARKNYRICFPDDSERSDLTNENLVAESVKLNEKLCTGSSLKFGLCEGSVLEFKAFDVPSMNGCRLQVFHEIDCSSIDEDLDGIVYREDLGFKVYPVPMGFYTVSSCIEDAGTGIMKVTAYNKLNSKILDADITAETQARISAGSTVFALVYDYLKDFAIEKPSVKTGGQYQILDHSDVPILLDLEDGQTGYVYMIGCNVAFEYYTSSFFDFIKFMLNLKAIREFTATDYDDYIVHGTGKTLKEYINQDYRYQAVTLHYTAEDETSQTVRINISDGEDFSSGWINALKMEASDVPSMIAIECLGCYYTGDYMSEYTSAYIQYRDQLIQKFIDSDCYGAYAIDHTYIERMSIDTSTQIESATAREIQSAIYEMDCLFGKLDRSTDLFSGIALNSGELLPSDSVYPQNALYPSGATESTPKSVYKELYTNNQDLDSFKYLIITYKSQDEEGNEVEKTLQRTVNTNGSVNYNMTDNWIFKNMVWDSRSVGLLADEMVLKMQDLRWFPFQMEAVGLPYIECGDLIEISARSGAYCSYVLERDIAGIWDLEDDFYCGKVETF